MAEINFTEKELEDFLCSDNQLEKRFNLKFIARQVNTLFGIIDILAYSKLEKCFYIIELKKDYLDYKAFFQADRYLKYFTHKYRDNKKFKVLLIGQNLRDELHYIVENFGNNSDSDKYMYSLFALDFNTGVDFDYHDKRQREISEKLNELLMDAEDKQIELYYKAKKLVGV